MLHGDGPCTTLKFQGEVRNSCEGRLPLSPNKGHPARYSVHTAHSYAVGHKHYKSSTYEVENNH
jgi:hypothetical protein